MRKFFTLQNYCFLDTYTSTQNSHFLVAHIAVIRYTQAPQKTTPHTMRDNRQKKKTTTRIPCGTINERRETR